MTCISLIISDVEHFIMGFLAICLSSLDKCFFRSFTHFLTGLGFLSCMSFLYILEITHLSVDSFAIFSPILRVVFLFCLSFLFCTKAFV